MALGRWNAAAIDDAGNKMDGASVEVRRESDNVLASVYSDRAGTASLGNPFTAADGGNIGFHVVGSVGGYKIVATLGAVSRTWRNQPIGTAQELDIEDVEGIPLTYLDTDGTLAANSDVKVSSQKAVKTYADARETAAKAYADTLVVGLFDDRGNWDASGNLFPSGTGSGSAGAVLKGDTWRISVAGTLGGVAVANGDWVRALVDTPGQTAGNWTISEANIADPSSYATKAANLSDLTAKYTARDNLSVHGADIASAATLNLEAATGIVVDVTGTTTVTAITLSDGHERIVRFTGILTLTHGASLVLPGSVNKITAAGDFAVFRGYAAGVVRMQSYQRAVVATARADLGFTAAGDALAVAADAAAQRAAIGVVTTGMAYASLPAANFNSTADQAIPIVLPAGMTRYAINAITVSNPSISMTTAVGGVYNAAAKGGVAIVANTQAYSGLTNSTPSTAANAIGLSLVLGGTIFHTAAILYFSLTTPQGAAATADVVVHYRPYP